MSTIHEDKMLSVTEKGLGVDPYGKPLLEAIAMSLGYKGSSGGEGETVAESLSSIASSLERIATALENRD